MNEKYLKTGDLGKRIKPRGIFLFQARRRFYPRGDLDSLFAADGFNVIPNGNSFHPNEASSKGPSVHVGRFPGCENLCGSGLLVDDARG